MPMDFPLLGERIVDYKHIVKGVNKALLGLSGSSPHDSDLWDQSDIYGISPMFYSIHNTMDKHCDKLYVPLTAFLGILTDLLPLTYGRQCFRCV